MSFLYGQGRYEPKIDVLKLEDNYIEFKLSNVDLSFANTLRRIIIGEVPTMAIDMVQVDENTSPLFDEFIVHRLGLIPLVSEDIDSYNFTLKCNCKEGCPKCKVNFQIKVKCEESKDLDNESGEVGDRMSVTSNDILPLDPNCKVVPVQFKPPIVIARLKKGQSIKMILSARKGIGKEHAKWSPVCTCVMKEIPDIQISYSDNNFLKMMDEDKKMKFIESCPSKVFNYDKEKEEIIVEKPDKCTYCEECLTMTQELIKMKDYEEYKKKMEPVLRRFGEELGKRIERLVTIKDETKRNLEQISNKQQLKKMKDEADNQESLMKLILKFLEINPKEEFKSSMEIIKDIKNSVSFIEDKRIKKLLEFVSNENLRQNAGLSLNYREMIKVEPKTNEFLFKVESTGALSPKKIILKAFEVLQQKMEEINKILTEIEELNEL